MNLNKLFEMQKKLDEDIIKKKGLEGRDLLPEKTLALQVELGECANEWRGFKFWSADQEPKTMSVRQVNHPNGHGPMPDFYNPLLEEYVDCLHFILSIGLEFDIEDVNILNFAGISAEKNIIDAFQSVFEWISAIDFPAKGYTLAFSRFIELGEMLGFTWEQVEEAYIKKNQINFDRQVNGY